ncbi:hypothetical protein JOD24_003140 [Kroppenstedtia sanguinis]
MIGEVEALIHILESNRLDQVHFEEEENGSDEVTEDGHGS